MSLWSSKSAGVGSQLSTNIVFFIVQNCKSAIFGFPDLQAAEAIIDCQSRTLQFPGVADVSRCEMVSDLEKIAEQYDIEFVEIVHELELIKRGGPQGTVTSTCGRCYQTAFRKLFCD